MKATLIIVAFVLVITGVFFVFDKESNSSATIPIDNNTSTMQIKSSAFTNREKIPSKYTCDGANINPELLFLNIPKDTKSLALIFDDPDAPSGTWLHWSMWNISPDTKEIPENSIPTGSVSGTTSFGNVGYGGPCPGVGEHRYFFRLFALDIVLDIPSGENRTELEKTIAGHIIEQTKLIGTYSRN